MLQSLVAQPMMRLLALASLATIPSEISHDVEEKIYSTPIYLFNIDKIYDLNNMKMFSLDPFSNSSNVNPIESSALSNPANLTETVEQQFKGIFNSTACLPQFDTTSNTVIRKVIMNVKKLGYNFDYNTNIVEAPMLATNPITNIINPNELPSKQWQVMLSEVLLTISDDNSKALVTEIVEENKLENLFELLPRFDRNHFYMRPQNIESYIDIFDEKPQSAYEFDMDEAFARWRLAGPNPMTIQLCTQEILNTKVYMNPLPSNVKRNIKKAMEERRLFVVDYSALGDLPASKNHDSLGVYQKYNVAPLALFEIPSDEATRNREWLKVMAIQCDRIDPQKTTKPSIFTPQDGMKWRMAKAIFNSADGGFHQAVVHLGWTHLVVETFVVSTHRALPPQHPIYVLLRDHLEGTAYINFLADKRLINPDSLVDHYVNYEISSLNKLVGQLVLAQLSDDFSFPAMLKRRNMTKENFPATFPYRDDGQLYWDAIRNWVEDYLSLYYGDDKETQMNRMQNDYELRAWIDELRSDNGGRVKWLDSFYSSPKPFKMLCHIVAAIVFTASTQHAAVNFPQKPIESFIPAYPLGMYRPPPKQNDEPTMQDYLDMLPPMEMAQSQKQVGFLLGGLHYKTLGQYGDEYFTDQRVYERLVKFQIALKDIQRIIEQRNKERMAPWVGVVDDQMAKYWSYEFLYPKNIPQGINI